VTPAAVTETSGSATRARGTNVPAAGRCPCCRRRLREHAEALAVRWVLGPGDELGLVTIADVAEGAQLPRRLAERVVRRAAGPFEAVVRGPWRGRPTLYRIRRGWRP
jgi:hypothetical protein